MGRGNSNNLIGQKLSSKEVIFLKKANKQNPRIFRIHRKSIEKHKAKLASAADIEEFIENLFEILNKERLKDLNDYVNSIYKNSSYVLSLQDNPWNGVFRNQERRTPSVYCSGKNCQ